MPLVEFTAHEATVHRAIVVSFDLADFSDFLNQPETAVAAASPQLVKRVFDLLNAVFSDTEESSWTLIVGTNEKKLPAPNVNKFTGDGAVMIWVRPTGEDFPQDFCNLLVQSFRDFQRELRSRLPLWEKEWRISRLPRQARVGIATGIVYALRPPHTVTWLTAPRDFIGYCINLAVRLQDYCPELGFLVHGHLHPELPGMELSEAAPMKGTQVEPVAFFREDASRVPVAEFGRKFRPRHTI